MIVADASVRVWNWISGIDCFFWTALHGKSQSRYRAYCSQSLSDWWLLHLLVFEFGLFYLFVFSREPFVVEWAQHNPMAV